LIELSNDAAIPLEPPAWILCLERFDDLEKEFVVAAVGCAGACDDARILVADLVDDG
jgi:hypothetical protein